MSLNLDIEYQCTVVQNICWVFLDHKLDQMCTAGRSSSFTIQTGLLWEKGPYFVLTKTSLKFPRCSHTKHNYYPSPVGTYTLSCKPPPWMWWVGWGGWHARLIANWTRCAQRVEALVLPNKQDHYKKGTFTLCFVSCKNIPRCSHGLAYYCGCSHTVYRIIKMGCRTCCHEDGLRSPHTL